jgi:hypothetical protein
MIPSLMRIMGTSIALAFFNFEAILINISVCQPVEDLSILGILNWGRWK